MMPFQNVMRNSINHSTNSLESMPDNFNHQFILGCENTTCTNLQDNNNNILSLTSHIAILTLDK